MPGEEIETINAASFAKTAICLASDFPELNDIVESFGIPEFWSRPQGFETLVLIILEQQVSTSSAAMAFKRIVDGLGEVSSEVVANAGIQQLQLLGITRQKADYITNLAVEIERNRFPLDRLENRSDEEVRMNLKSLRGIGPWTANVYLMSALCRADIWLPGDLALKATLQKIFADGAGKHLENGARWAPFRSTAVRLLWHKYLSEN